MNVAPGGCALTLACSESPGQKTVGPHDAGRRGGAELLVVPISVAAVGVVPLAGAASLVGVIRVARVGKAATVWRAERLIVVWRGDRLSIAGAIRVAGGAASTCFIRVTSAAI